MKTQLVKEYPKTERYSLLSHADGAKSYGVQKEIGKGFVFHVNGAYIVISCRCELTTGNCFRYGEKELIKLLNILVSEKDTKVYQFDTTPELLAWLAVDTGRPG